MLLLCLVDNLISIGLSRYFENHFNKNQWNYHDIQYFLRKIIFCNCVIIQSIKFNMENCKTNTCVNAHIYFIFIIFIHLFIIIDKSEKYFNYLPQQ